MLVVATKLESFKFNTGFRIHNKEYTYHDFIININKKKLKHKSYKKRTKL